MSGGEMNIVIGIVLSFLLMLFVFVPLGIAGAVAFTWIGNKAFDFIADAQERQQEKDRC